MYNYQYALWEHQLFGECPLLISLFVLVACRMLFVSEDTTIEIWYCTVMQIVYHLSALDKSIRLIAVNQCRQKNVSPCKSMLLIKKWQINTT